MPFKKIRALGSKYGLGFGSLNADLVGQVDVAIGVCGGPLGRVVSQRRLSYSDRRLWRVALLQLRNTVLLLLFQK